MNKNIVLITILIVFVIVSCNKENFNSEIVIPNFNFPKTITFEDSLSEYGIFEGLQSELIPSENFKLLEISSIFLPIMPINNA